MADVTFSGFISFKFLKNDLFLAYNSGVMYQSTPCPNIIAFGNITVGYLCE